MNLVGRNHSERQNIQRLAGLDAFRGLIMVLMALDHASYFIARARPSEFWGWPLPEYTSHLAFLTRFVTHICAPGFFFLMGMGMVLFANSRRRLGWPESKIIKFFIVRGLLLIVLQVFVENPAWSLGAPAASAKASNSPVIMYAGVLYGLGATMIFGSVLLRIKQYVLLSLSAMIVLLTQIATSIFPGPGNLESSLLALLLLPGTTGVLLVKYPVLPWMGITLLGMAFGRELLRNPLRAYQFMLFGSISFLVLFIIVRTTAGFGNTHPPLSNDWVGYLNLTKYPPSIAFTSLTLGLNFLLIFLFSRFEGVFQSQRHPLLIFGRTALFFYILHLYVYGLMGTIMVYSAPLIQTYMFWLVGLLLLYPLCMIYFRFKNNTGKDSIWRLF